MYRWILLQDLKQFRETLLLYVENVEDILNCDIR